MLKTLDYSCTFPTTGRTLSGQFAFQKGFGAIVGPNEAGKSFILEMIRFCLFGTAALRGVSSDYKTLKASLTFEVRKSTYSVKRTISTAKLFRGDTEIANGVKAVNQKVADTLGFGLTVFDVSCAANQGNIEKLGDMKPTERKQMVDSVIGLSVIDELTKWCGDEALNLSRLIEGLDRNLVEPQKPAAPADYTASAGLRGRVEELRASSAELQRLRGWLAVIVPPPVAPIEPTTRSTQELQDALDAARRYEAARKELDALPAAPTHSLEALEAEHAAYELWQEREAFLRNHPTTLTADQIAQAKEDNALYEQFQEAEAAEVKLGKHADHHCCPACAHEWPVDPERFKALKGLTELAKARVADKVKPARPDMNAVSIAERQLQAWEKDAATWERLKDVPEASEPQFTRRQLAQMRVAADAQAKRPALEAIVAVPVEDAAELNKLLRARISYETLLTAYDKLVVTYDDWCVEYHGKSERADELVHLVEELPELEARLEAAVLYESQLARYGEEILTFLARQAEIDKLRTEEDGYRRGKASLVLLRKLVKQHLIPSLNRVASHLIKQMTGGERQVIEVTDDFDITVDGQALDTLSGSGKAVANLSLRLGLGQVLTNGQFSIFLADEIDASMDKNRAGQTALTLEYLAEKLSQILLITHKYPQADYYIELGKRDEQSD